MAKNANNIKPVKHKEGVKMKEEELTYKIRGCIYEVSKELGAGFLEQVYKNALLQELNNVDLKCESEKKIAVQYKGKEVGIYVADIIVQEKVILELKAVKQLTKTHEAQILNYLKGTGIKVGLLINFSHPKAEIKRFIL